jgi:succinyl-CoA synthetase alpha subunit
MNKQESYLATVSLVVISGALVAALYGVIQFNEVLGQNTTTTANQTGTAMANQTATGLGNLTVEWFEGVEGDIAAAREGLHTENLAEAYTAIGNADDKLFGIATDPFTGSTMIVLIEKFKPLDDPLTAALVALRNNDSAKALQEINTADAELLKLNQQLPPE